MKETKKQTPTKYAGIRASVKRANVGQLVGKVISHWKAGDKDETQ